jgi:hypothetical protein
MWRMGALAKEGLALKDTDRVTIGICSPGYVVTDFLTSLLDVARSQKQLGQFISLQGSGVISRLRNQVVATFLDKTKDEWLLQIDTDQRFTVDTFKKLLAAADEKERPIVSGVVHGGWEVGEPYLEPVPCIFKLGTDNGLFAIHEYPEDSIIEIDAAGTGAILVHRSVFERFRKEADQTHQGDKWGYYQDMPLHNEWVGEDLLWCIRARSFGYKLYAHTGVQMEHQRKMWIGAKQHKDFARFRRTRLQSEEQIHGDNNKSSDSNYNKSINNQRG